MTETVRQFTVGPDDDQVRLDRWFKRNLPEIGFATISRWARTGQIRVDGKRADPADRVSAGQVLRVPPGTALPVTKKPRVREPLDAEQVARAEAMVITQDRAAIVLNKPPGLATQGGSGTFDHVDRLLDAFAGDDQPRPRLVHRLDKDTSGVLLIARTPGSAAFFSKRFSGRSAKKTYWALVVGVPEEREGMIEAALAKQPGSGGEKMHVDVENGQPAKTKYRVIDRAGNRAAWVELQPLTGRTHQLRVHMAAIGHPIVGDGKYGGQLAFLTGSVSRKMHLHARRLVIDHPQGDMIDVTAPLPEHFAATLEQLGFTESEGDVAPPAPLKPPPAVAKKQAAKAHAKDLRKERRGERRGRGEAPAPRKVGPPGKAPPKSKSASRPFKPAPKAPKR
ncbi:MAG: RluA family pseudouridine synthase [Novosphingobium sp.]|nr:RluA family pseudouridine synthase [Novosphingobium sp.]